MTTDPRPAPQETPKRVGICLNCWAVVAVNGEENPDRPPMVCSHLRVMEFSASREEQPPPVSDDELARVQHALHLAGVLTRRLSRPGGVPDAAWAARCRLVDALRGTHATVAGLRSLGAGPRLNREQMNALIHAAGYVLRTTTPEEYRYYRDQLRPAQRVLRSFVEEDPK
jgi:hypothetical protein